jgi:ACS family hexuronate transporter-like MFS transporter
MQWLLLGMGFVGFVESPYAAVALLSLGGYAHQTLSVTVITMSSDLFPRNEVATAAGMATIMRAAALTIPSGEILFFIGIAGLVDR